MSLLCFLESKSIRSLSINNLRIVLILSFLFLSHASFGCQLIVRMENFNPESRLNSNSSWQGVDVELTDKFLKQVGCRYSIVELPWARSLQMLAVGEIDMMINVSKTKEREELFHFVGPIREEVIVLAKLVDQGLVLNGVNDILTLDKPIAVQRAAFYGPEIEGLMRSKEGKGHFIEVVDNETKLMLMRTGRIAGFLEAERNLTIGPNKTPRYQGIDFHSLIIHKKPGLLCI